LSVVGASGILDWRFEIGEFGIEGTNPVWKLPVFCLQSGTRRAAIQLRWLQEPGTRNTDGILEPSSFAGQPCHSATVAQHDGKARLDANQSKLLVDLLHVNAAESKFHKSSLLHGCFQSRCLPLRGPDEATLATKAACCQPGTTLFLGSGVSLHAHSVPKGAYLRDWQRALPVDLPFTWTVL
jgi:hypothetical protein